mgnify:CR=1 FL=1
MNMKKVLRENNNSIKIYLTSFLQLLTCSQITSITKYAIMNKTTNNNTSGDKSYDLQLINKMCRGNEEQVHKMVKLFIEQISKSMEEIKTAYHEKDFVKIKKLAHKIKPTLSYFGTTQLQDEFKHTVLLLSEENISAEADSKVENLLTMTNDIVQEIKSDFNIENK